MHLLRTGARRMHAHANALAVLESRGMLSAVTARPALARLLQRPERPAVYAGFDPTAPSLHVGNLLSIVALMLFAAAGHRAIVLVGGSTGSIGDPSGKSSERKALDKAVLDANVASIHAQLERLLKNASEYAATRTGRLLKPFYQPEGAVPLQPVPMQIVNNSDWYSSMSLLHFIGSIGRHARVGSMLSRESVKSRLKSPDGISFTEFSYQLLQAYDFWHLFSHFGCTIQLGGSDQWGNILSGVELIRKYTGENNAPVLANSQRGHEHTPNTNMESVDSAFGITIPLVTTATGEKFGKSAGNAIWLDESLLSVFDFYQFFRRTPDDQVFKYLAYFTFLSISEINDIHDSHMATPQHHLPQKMLAKEVTELVHGATKSKKAVTMSSVLFESGAPETHTAKDILDAFEGDSRLKILNRGILIGQNICNVAVECGACKSKSAAKKLISSGGLYLNKKRVDADTLVFSESDLLENQLFTIRTGKNNYTIARV